MNKTQLRIFKQRARNCNASAKRYGWPAIPIESFLARYGEPPWLCPYCLQKFTTSKISFDHVVPLSREGEHSLSNIWGVCRRCNLYKRALSVEDWMALLKALDKAGYVKLFFANYVPRRY